MSSGMGRELLDGIQSGAQEMVKERIDGEVSRIQIMDITRAAAALLDANVEEETIERLLCKYWDLRPSEAHRFIHEGEEERKI
ncbi:hypothetical protein [Parablautia muri]|uniref:Uncharacterized protein n=1 Tax=Parablautia muri TaxID=2320879 RepID=A0A9X5BGT0_9FIRM|nr:hypothetical protein [Parablautia muri]NBJ93528.1 hypothetical protein [Parablautia muri]